MIKPEDIVKQPSESVQFSEQQESAPSIEPSESVQFYSEQQESVQPSEQPLETMPSSEQQQESVPSSELSSSSKNESSKDTQSLKETLDIDKSLSQKSLARLTVENGNVSFVQQQKAFMVTGTQGKVYAVTLLLKEKCQCPSTTHCYHILAAKMYIGDDIENKPRVVNLRMLSKRSLRRNDKKSGNHVEMILTMQRFYQLLLLKKLKTIEPPYTPVSLTPKTTAKPVSSKKTPISKKKLQLEENTEYTTPKTGKQLRFTDEDEVHIISPVPLENPYRLPVKKRKASTDTKKPTVHLGLQA